MASRKILLAVFAALCLVNSISSEAPPCDASATCDLPDCRCSGVDIPGGLRERDIPQVTFTLHYVVLIEIIKLKNFCSSDTITD